MCPPTASPLADIGSDSTAEKFFVSLERMTRGCPLPENVITDVNPYCHAPSNLPDNIWYLIHSKENDDMELGSWKVKGEACKIFSNSLLTGWRTTYEFFEDQVPHERKTDWIMEVYWITHNTRVENRKAKEAISLCRLFLDGEHKLQQKSTSSKIVSEDDPFLIESIVPQAHGVTSNGSTSKPEVDKDDEAKEMAVSGVSPHHLVQNQPEVDYISRGDYMELLDLDYPASRSSSSDDNSSCLTMSSDDYFDSLALLGDIESENNNQGLVLKDENCTSGVSATLEPKYRDEGSSWNSLGASASSSGHIASQDGEKKTSKDKKRKLNNKYLCFMPFHFLF